jgi:hypothetical protein
MEVVSKYDFCIIIVFVAKIAKRLKRLACFDKVNQ